MPLSLSWEIRRPLARSDLFDQAQVALNVDLLCPSGTVGAVASLTQPVPEDQSAPALRHDLGQGAKVADDGSPVRVSLDNDLTEGLERNRGDQEGDRRSLDRPIAELSSIGDCTKSFS